MSYFTLALFPMCYILSLSLSYMLLLPWRLPPLSTFLLGVYTLSFFPRSCAFLALGTPHHDTVLCYPKNLLDYAQSLFKFIMDMALGSNGKVNLS